MDMLHKVQSKKSFEKAISDLKESLSNYKFGVLWELNFKDKLHEKGVDFDYDYVILEVCNPLQAKSVLEKNLDVGFFLPCKLVVYEQFGEVIIGMMKPKEFIRKFDDEELTVVAAQVEEDLILAIENAK